MFFAQHPERLRFWLKASRLFPQFGELLQAVFLPLYHAANEDDQTLQPSFQAAAPDLEQ